MQAVVKVAPALAAGCAVLLKPSPLASLSCLQLEAIATEAGLPNPNPYPNPNLNPDQEAVGARARHVQACSAATGQGVAEGLEWLSSTLTATFR